MTNHCVMCDSEIPPRTDGREVCPWCGTEHVGIVPRSTTNHFRLDLTLVQLEEQRDALIAALREAEWGARNSWDDPACPVCVNTKTQGHFVHCAVGKVLAAAEPFDERTNLTCRASRRKRWGG